MRTSVTDFVRECSNCDRTGPRAVAYVEPVEVERQVVGVNAHGEIVVDSAATPTEGGELGPAALWCRQCLTSIPVPDDTEIDWD